MKLVLKLERVFSVKTVLTVPRTKLKISARNLCFRPNVAVEFCGSTCDVVKAGFVKGAHEELETNDGVNDDDEEDKEGDVDQGDDGHEDGIHDDLETWHSGDKPQGSQNSEGSQGFDIKALDLKDGKHFTDHSEIEKSLQFMNGQCLM